jgi:NADH:ubiquinone oxidoreductase subunit C
MIDVNELVAALHKACPSAPLTVRAMPVAEHVVLLPAACLRDAVGVLLDPFAIYHLSAITGQDVEGQIELLYHFWCGGGITLHVTLPRDPARIDSIVDLVPGASFYEREVAEMLGVTFAGHPDPRPLLLPEDWVGEPPLRREFTFPEAREGEA